MERFSLDPGRFTWNRDSLDGHWIGVNDSTFARAPEADENGNYRHGEFTVAAIDERRMLRAWIKAAHN
jgi:hypothetical protein